MRLGTVAVLLALLAAAIQAQVGETIEVRLIEIDAVVTDRAGNPVTGLTAADFELFENGNRQTITNFAEYRETAVIASVSEAPGGPAGPTPQHTVAQPSPRTIVFFIDALPVRGPARTKLFDNLRSLVARALRDGDRAQVLSWNDHGGIRATSPLTGDRAVIEKAIADAENGNDPANAGASVEEYNAFFTEMAAAGGQGDDMGNRAATERFAAEHELAVMRRKTAAMHRIVAALAQPKGKSAFVYVSERFPAVAGRRAATPRRPDMTAEAMKELTMRPQYTTRHLLGQVIDAANANGVAFYALRPERPWTSPVGSVHTDAQVFNTPNSGLEAQSDEIVLQNEVEALSLVAEETGGAFGVGPGAVEQLVDRIVTDLGSYYTLAYRARSDGTDRERRIEVRARNRDYVVRARRSVVEKSDRTRRRDLAVARLFERGPAGDLPFDVSIGKGMPEGSRLIIPVTLTIPVGELKFEEEGNELAAKFTVMSVAGATLQSAGTVTEESKRITAPLGSQPEGTVKFTIPVLHDRKQAMLSIAVFDEKSGLAGTRQIALEGGSATVAESAPDPAADEKWSAALARANRERKPLLLFFKAASCRGCHPFEQQWMKHPAIQRRLAEIVFATLPASSPRWEKRDDSGLALYDRGGTFRARWIGVPHDMTTFATILDGILGAAPNLERAVALAEREGPHEGEVEAAFALAKLGRTADARAALERAKAHGSARTRDFAVIAGAILDANDGNTAQAHESLQTLVAGASSTTVAGNAWMAIGMLHRNAGALDEALRAYRTAIRVAGSGTDIETASRQAIASIEAAGGAARGAIRLIPPTAQVVSGRQTIRTNVTSTDVARVELSIDGAESRSVTRPPFTATFDFGAVPQTRIIRALAFDAKNNELGRDELTVNPAGETFWLRLVEPRQGPASGKVRVSATLRAPAGRSVKRVVLSWNDAQRATIAAAPWQTELELPNELGILRAVAELDDGRTSEDAVLLNASGHVDRADAVLVELPIITADRDAATPAAAEISIREGRARRSVEAVLSASEAALTVGLLFDSSTSMQPNKLDVQEAAITFLDTILGHADRAFLISFDSTARLLQPPTTDRDVLRRQIMSIQAGGSTSLHDAMILGLLQFEGVKGRRALVVFSDGADVSSRYGAKDVEELARRSNIPVYVITARPTLAPARPNPVAGVRTPGTPGAVVQTVGAAQIWASAVRDLRRVCESTGGRLHMLETLDELPKVYAEIAADLRAQLLAVIRTDPGKHENDWRSIDVDVAGRRGVRAPEGYYAPW